MKFERLRLLGFKSFVEPTEIVIQPGLTGVVGPNGCGKSNLLEAMRWVMGESSYKAMRGGGMEDVIFAGSRNRPERNNAEVTLFLDNSARKAPAAFNDDDALEISRRIERGAGSSYRINGRDARARDVQLLFADASTGAHSPALVRQGQIGEMISAKPRARRRILEEAAGISGLHTRRHEAELRLRAAETNLERLGDVMGQIESQIAHLKRQARQASRYKALSGEIREAESIQAHLRWREAATLVSTEETALNETTREVAGKTEATAATSKEQVLAAEKLPGLREAEARAAAALHRVEVEREGLDAEEERARTRLSELANRLEHLGQDKAREEKAISDTREMLDRLVKEEADIARYLDGDAGRQTKAQAALDRSSAVLSDAETSFDAKTRDIAALRAEREQYDRLARQQSQRIEQLNRQRAGIEDERSRLTGDDGRSAGLERLHTAMEAAQNAATLAQTQATSQESALEKARRRESEARAAKDEAERTAQTLTTEARTLIKLLRVGDGDLWPPLIDALKVEQGYETALGAALGDDLTAPADESAPVHWAETPAKEDPSLPKDVEPLAAHVRAPKALRRRLAQIGVVSREQGGALRLHLKPGQRLVTLKGDLWRWDGYAATAEAPTAAAERLAQRNRLGELEIAARKAGEQAQSARRAFEDAHATAAHTEAAGHKARATWREAENLLKAAQNALMNAERKAQSDTARLSALAEAHSRVKADLGEADRLHREARTKLDGLGAPATFEEPLEALRANVAEARAQHAQAQAGHEGLLREAREKTARHEAISREREAWELRTANADKQIETLIKRGEDARAEARVLSDLPAEITKRRNLILDQVGKAQETRRTAADILATGEKALAEADARAREAQAELAKTREQRAFTEAHLESARERLADIEHQIQDALGCRPEDCLTHAGIDGTAKLPPLNDLERRLTRLKAERERLGGVNLRAEQELQELAAQRDGMAAEREDLEKAIAKLRQGINKLNKEGRKRLLEAFKTVNVHFQRLFTHLFEGGKAELQLTESDDPLEAGLEILARPPGKRPQILTLLSGGEQTLTALSLILAVFLTNPAPICVLDEVDAPLDDANVERFCNLMDEMTRSTDTRFLIITHHPLTMARMNRLFGVTMAEKGVSQLVSVDLQEAERFREAV